MMASSRGLMRVRPAWGRCSTEAAALGKACVATGPDYRSRFFAGRGLPGRC
jgi:hypothetical protein